MELGTHHNPLFNSYQDNNTLQLQQPLTNRKRQRESSPARKDPLLSNLNPSLNSNHRSDNIERTYKDIMLEQKAKAIQIELLKKEKREEFKKIKLSKTTTTSMTVLH